MVQPADFLAPDGRLAARLAGWESRPQQLEMAELVAQAIRERRHAIIEHGDEPGEHDMPEPFAAQKVCGELMTSLFLLHLNLCYPVDH